MELNGRTEDIHGNHTGYFYIELPLRDLFAAFALAGLMEEGLHPGVAAKEAYEYADAAIAAREGVE
jgi:hypothetical protein